MPDWGAEAAARRLRHFRTMVMAKRAIIYVDGYNLYYSRLRGTPYKWLDLVQLFRDCILKPQVPDAELVGLKFFTAPAMAKFASHGHDSMVSQNEYHRALRARHKDLIEIISGYHTHQESPLMRFAEPPDKNDRVSVWLIEEKQTDVNLALSIYRDVAKDRANLVVACSNDSDLEPAIKSLREDFPSCEIGIVAPLPEPDGERYRRGNAKLEQLADWTRSYILDEELAKSQLPEIVPTRKKAARKPAYW